jgi:hypothetical protein
LSTTIRLLPALDYGKQQPLLVGRQGDPHQCRFVTTASVVRFHVLNSTKSIDDKSVALRRSERGATAPVNDVTSSRRLFAGGWADGTPGAYVPNNSFPGLGTVQRTIQLSQRTYRKYGVRSITRRCVSCPQVAHGAKWTRSRRRSTGVPVSVACSGFRGPSGSMSASGKCEDKNDGGAKSVASLLWLGNRDLGTSVRGIRQRSHGERPCRDPRVPRRVQPGAPGPSPAGDRAHKLRPRIPRCS